MRTPQQWWNDTKSDPDKFNNWLKDQYHGELTAVDRIEKYLMVHTHPDTPQYKMLKFVKDQEAEHASWVKDLLEARGLEATKLDKTERYWDKTLPNITDLEYGSAVAAHAEEMRLERIKVIVVDPDSPEDVRAVFTKILPQELGHASIFGYLAGDKKGEAAEAHARGLEALGLIL